MVALWADSTYAYIEEELIRNIAVDLKFPLVSFACMHGAGLCSNDEGVQKPCPTLTAAAVVIIEMGYNDASSTISTREDAVAGMRKQSWFKALQNQAFTVQRVIFIKQPEYINLAQKKIRGKKIYNKPVKGSMWTTEAEHLVRNELHIQTDVLDVPGEHIFAGFIRVDGQLSQVEANCRFKCADEQQALWEDAHHPTSLGAAAHFQLLLGALKKSYGGDLKKRSLEEEDWIRRYGVQQCYRCTAQVLCGEGGAPWYACGWYVDGVRQCGVPLCRRHCFACEDPECMESMLIFCHVHMKQHNEMHRPCPYTEALFDRLAEPWKCSVCGEKALLRDDGNPVFRCSACGGRRYERHLPPNYVHNSDDLML